MVPLSTKIASLHPIRVIIKATSRQILCLQDLDQLLRLRRSEKWSVTFSLLAQLRCIIRVICFTHSGRAWFYYQRWSYENSLLVDGKSLKSLEEWNFLGQKFLTTELSLKDIELGLKSPMESFPFINLQSVAGWEYTCLRKERIKF